MHQPSVRLSSRLLSYLISVLLAGQPLLPALGAAIAPRGATGVIAPPMACRLLILPPRTAAGFHITSLRIITSVRRGNPQQCDREA